ncbi:MAG: hypothetical protein LBL61_02895 [Elusimicrobiota bacterium]|jgi:4-hydroxy-tetrahydrodipicolinate reductase|nr:hypothetical protein [Elusimicrobiota bacterium]
MIKTLLNGAQGKMGAAIAQIIEANPDYNMQITARRDDGLRQGGEDFDLVIDFSRPSGAQDAFEIALERKAAFLTGTTGLPADFTTRLKEERAIPVFYSPNVSIGMHLFTKLAREANKLFAVYTKTLHESHHAQKKDAPSGTAKSLAAALSFPQEQITYERAGTDPGTHAIKFTSQYKDEEISLSHRALDRALFAYSAIIIARWLVRQKPGFYDMDAFAGGSAGGQK